MKNNGFSDWYEQNSVRYDSFCKEMDKLLCSVISNEKIHYHSITHRLKEKKSFLEKCDKKQYDDPSKQLMDFAGVRVIAYTTADVVKICDIIEREFQIDKPNSGNKADLLENDKVGYLSIHYVISLSSKRITLPEYAAYKGMCCEIQVRTLLQHAWAEIEHDRGYKFSGVLPKEIDRRFRLIAGVLEVVDSEFQRLSDDIDAHSQEVKKATQQGNYDIPIDSASLAQYVNGKLGDHAGNVEATFRNRDEQIIQELNDYGVNKLFDLEPLFADSRIKAINWSEHEKLNYLSFLRSVMIIANTKKYFGNAWNGHWTRVNKYITDFWARNGADLTLLPSEIKILN